MPEPTILQAKLAGQIVSHARISGWQIGHHLTEDSLLPVLGTSRSPIRAAMASLEAKGVLEKRPNRGFFLRKFPENDQLEEMIAGESAKDKVYLAIAMDRLAGQLPDELSENEFMRRYDLSRAQLRLVLARITAEGWIERKPGRGWAFQSLIDTLDAYHENYRFRQMLEPQVMRAPEFRVDLEKLSQLEAQQRAVRDTGYRTMSKIELFALSSRFHEGLAEMGNNRFFLQALIRLNQLRRLYEYGRPIDREWTRLVSDEHLAILTKLKAGDITGAADCLERHLTSAVRMKVIRNKQQTIEGNGA